MTGGDAAPRFAAVRIALGLCALLSIGIASGSSAARLPMPADSAGPAARALEVAHVLRERLPAALLHQGPGMERLLRERLSLGSDVGADDLSAALDLLLPDGGRLPIGVTPGARACALCRADAASMLLDAVASSTPAITRGSRGLQLELGEIAWHRTVATNVVGHLTSEYLAGRQQEANPEFARLKVELAIAMRELDSSEADSRSDQGLLATLAVISARRRVDDLHRDLRATPPYQDADIRQRYAFDVVEARETGTISATVTLRDPATRDSASMPVMATCERRANGTRGVRSDDANGYAHADAEALLPGELALFAAAFDELRAQAASLLVVRAGEMSLRRAARVNRPGRGGEALGWLLFARDCGVTPPESSGWQDALGRLPGMPYARLSTLRLNPFSSQTP